MTWEIAVGIFTLVGAFSAVMQVVMKVNKTLVGLDDSVKQLKKFMERQAKKNEDFLKKLAQHELRLSRLEESGKESTNGKS
jgi:septal ring factor EnvC (AmiA/AmiB activator)